MGLLVIDPPLIPINGCLQSHHCAPWKAPPPNPCCETVIMVRMCVSSPLWQRQMEREPPHLPQEAVYRILSGGSWRFLKFHFQVRAINLRGACLDQAGWRACLSTFTKDECGAAPLYSETSETVGWQKKVHTSSLVERASSLKKERKKGEAVGHQLVNKLPHSVTQAGETGADLPVMKGLWGLLAYMCAMGSC